MSISPGRMLRMNKSVIESKNEPKGVRLHAAANGYYCWSSRIRRAVAARTSRRSGLSRVWMWRRGVLQPTMEPSKSALSPELTQRVTNVSRSEYSPTGLKPIAAEIFGSWREARVSTVFGEFPNTYAESQERSRRARKTSRVFDPNGTTRPWRLLRFTRS